MSALTHDRVEAPLPRLESAAAGARVRAVFDAAGYTAAAVDTMLGRASGAARREVAAARADRDDAPGLLMRLFCGGAAVPDDALAAALPGPGRAILEAAGLLARDADGVRATVLLTPHGAHLYAHDRPERHRARDADFVVGPSPVARLLGAFVVPGTVDTALDLGCGAGVLALGALGAAGQVTATDINPRAVALTRFNALLNGRRDVRTACGDLFAPLGAARFDLVLSNPPFVLAPEATFLYRDGGPSMCARIVREAPAHLTVGGVLQMLCNWPERAGADWREVPRRWFDGSDCDAWVLRLRALGAREYALAWLGQEHAPAPVPAAALDRWSSHFAAHGIDAVATGLVVMRKPDGRAPWLELRDAPPLRGAAGASIARVLAARESAARLDDDAALLAACLRPNPDLEQLVRRR
ncbi:MAG: methyltransferase, partial [Gammaproteobacteria bacterium]